MKSDKEDNRFILTMVVANHGDGSKVLSEAKKNGVSGGTIFLGKGTVHNHLLEMLGIDEEKKEIVLLCSREKYENELHEILTNKFKMNKPGRGIMISLPMNKLLYANQHSTCEINTDLEEGGKKTMEYQAIFIIVDRGLGHEVVDVATEAGARGATIINARGSGIHEKEVFFSINIEPEKEIVMIIIKKEETDKIIDAVKEKMKIDEPGKGIIFVMDVTKASGLR
ncbi:MAG TPA: P-II family nitrogen regulator [Defluviitaleaceae bacterium]|nr:P-II family nitrogen regulator [Defluviitaleaceae bacterium]